MKRVNRWFAVLLCVALLCGTVPLTASASTVTELTELSVSVDAPMAGREADFDVHPVSSPVYGVRAYTEQTVFDNFYHGVSWYDETDGLYLKEGDSFVLGHRYTFRIYVTVNNQAYYRFASSLTVSVNGQTETVSRERDLYNCMVSYTFEACEEPPADIIDVTLGGVVYPVAGEHPVFELAYDEERFCPDEYAGSAFISGVAWYNSETFYILDETDVFEEGKAYTLMIQLRANDPYRFSVGSVAATVNGFPMDDISEQEGDPERVLKVSRTFACASADSVGGCEDEIRVKIEYPVGGEILSHTPDIFGTNIEYSGYTNAADNFYDGVQWINRTTGESVPNGSYARAGVSYSVAVLVDCKTVIDPDTWLSYIDLDGMCLSHVKATVNGLPARVEPFNDVDPAQTVKIVFDFPACGKERLVIDDITLSGVQAPLVGETPDWSGALTYRYQDSPTVTEQTIRLNWVEIGTGGEERVMENGDCFLLDCQYIVMPVLSAGPLRDFLTDGTGFDGTFTAKGSIASDAYVLSSKKMAAYALYATISERPDPIAAFDIVGLVPPEEGDRPCRTASLGGDRRLQIDSIVWETKDGVKLSDTDTFAVGTQYVAYIKVVPVYPYAGIVDLPTVTVNGSSDPYSGLDDSGFIARGHGSYASVSVVFDAVKSSASLSVTDYAEVEDVMRPAPGQHPDFTASVESAYTQFGGVTWCELDENGAVVGTLEPTDTFKADTVYRLEVRVTAPAGRRMNLDNRTNYLNGEATSYYSLSDTAAVLYAEYDTADCITELDVCDVQYPIAGKTPDTDVVLYGSVSILSYANNANVDWYYETNPGTSAAGFARLDGKFRSDRRHQAWIQLEAEPGRWFATDNEGNLKVEITMDTKPVDYAYSTDTMLTDGACNRLELGRTFERAPTVDGVFVDGMWLTDGLYLSNACWGVQTEETVDKTEGYAYYNDGILTLHSFYWETYGDYNAIDSYHPLTVYAEGNSRLMAGNNGIVASDRLTLVGNGAAVFYTRGEGLFAMDDVTVESGTWTVEDSVYDGLWLYSSLTVNGGTLELYGPNYGINGDDYPTVTVNGGTLIARAATDGAIAFCDVSIAEGASVTVGNTPDGVGAARWDGVTDFYEYAYAAITFEGDALLGDLNFDGTVNMMDALLLYGGTGGARNLTPEQAAVADLSGDGTVNMMDALLLYKVASGA